MKFLNTKYATSALKNKRYKRLHVLQCMRDSVNTILYDFVSGELSYCKINTDELIQSIYNQVFNTREEYFIIYNPVFELRINGKLTTKYKYLDKFGIKALEKKLKDQGYIDCVNFRLNNALKLSKFNYSVIQEYETVIDNDLNAILPDYYHELINLSSPIVKASKNYVLKRTAIHNSNLYV